MTDDPTDKPSDQPSQPDTEPTFPPPSTPPTEPSGVGFAAIRPPGPPTYNSYNPPPPPPPSAPVYQYDYSRTPKSGGSGSQVLLVAALGFMLVLVVGVGGMLAFGIGPFARPTPVATLVAQPTPTAHPITPVPTSSAVATSTALASPTDGAAPTPSHTPVPSGDVTDALLSHIPLPIEPFCIVEPTSGLGSLVASASCPVDGGNIQVLYLQYDSYDSMFAKYESYRLGSQIEAGSGDCNNHDTWPAEDAFNIAGQLAGRWLCTEALGSTQIYWTDNRLNILSQATQTVPDYQRFVDFWVHESGPNLQPFSN